MSVVSWQVAEWFRMASLTRLVVSRPSAGVKGGLGHAPLIQQASLPEASSWGSSISRMGRAEATRLPKASVWNWHTLTHPTFSRSKQVTRQAKLKWWGNGLQVPMEGTANYSSHFCNPPHSPSSFLGFSTNKVNTLQDIPSLIHTQDRQLSTVLKHTRPAVYMPRFKS